VAPAVVAAIDIAFFDATAQCERQARLVAAV
jgi:hypothetical protein